MIKYGKWCLCLCQALVISTAATAADPENGKKLLTTNCFHCHDTGVYTRADRRITSLPKLRAQVERCDTSLDLKLFDDDIDDITAWLNSAFYKFK